MFYALLIICLLGPCDLEHALLAEQSPETFSTESACYSASFRHAEQHLYNDDITFPQGKSYVFDITCELIADPA